MKFLQKLGKSLMLPVCVLPVCAVLMGIGYLLCPASMQGGEITGAVNTIGYLMVHTGSAIIDHMGILFAIGVAIGMSEDGHGTSALAGVVSWLVITTLLSVDVMSVVLGELDPKSTLYIAFSNIQNPTVGMLAGLIGATCYNKFRRTKLPDFLAFFSGKRAVSIVTVVVSLAAAAILAFVWPVCFAGMVKFGEWIVSLGGVGVGIYTFLNRLLIPLGLHHALNAVFLFDMVGIGDLTNFWAGKTGQDVGWSLGMYMSGFFPCIMFGIAGAAFAICKCAKNKKKAGGVLFSTVACAFLCGITEPFEFSFMFLCFPLYIAYSILCGIFAAVTYYTGFRAGFCFSAGLTDLIFSSSLPAAQRTLLILPIGIAAFAVFYLVFRFAILKFHIPTIGREEEKEEVQKEEPSVSADEKDMVQARGLVKAVGGKENVVSSTCCVTRLRLELKDNSLVNKELAKKYKAIDVLCAGRTSCQVIIGLTVQQVLEAFQKALQEPEDVAPAETAPAKPEVVLQGPAVTHGEEIRILLKRPAPAAEEARSSGSPIPFQKEADGTVVFRFTVREPSGLHARPAGQIAQIVKRYGVKAILAASGKTASAASPVELMELGVKGGTELTVKIQGDTQEAEAAARELGCFLNGSL